MSLNGSDNRHWVSPHGKTASKGTKSFELGLKEIGLFTKDSVKALDNANGLPKRKHLVLRQGENGTTGRTTSSKNPSTVPFTLDSVQKVSIGMPKVSEQRTDYLRVGWDGIHDKTSFKFYPGDAQEIEIVLQGAPLTMLNATGQYKLKHTVTTEGFDYGVCAEAGDLCCPIGCVSKTIEMVEAFNNQEWPTGGKVKDNFDIYPIFSEPKQAEETKVYKQYCLDFCGFGDFNELANVSAQYPGMEVKRDTMTNKFVMVIPEEDGAPEDYVQTMGSILKGCDDCPEGYSEIEGGYVYAIKGEDDGEDLTETISEFDKISPDTVKKVGQDFGVGYYIASATSKFTDEEIEELKNDSEIVGMVIEFIGMTNELCASDEEITHEWVECGSCETSIATYRIMIADDCASNRLEDLQERYPDLEIEAVEDMSANCVGVYETKVETKPSCSEGCNPDIIQQVFGDSNAPEPFDMDSYWYPVVEEMDEEDILCGFEIKAKPFIISPSDCLEDEMPFMATSIRITSISGGYSDDHSIVDRKANPVNVLVLDRAQDLDNLGGNLKGFEALGNYYFRHLKANADFNERSFSGNKSYLEGLEQYADISITIHTLQPHYMNVATPKAMTYHVLVPVGKEKEIVDLFTSIAGAAQAEIDYV